MDVRTSKSVRREKNGNSYSGSFGEKLTSKWFEFCAANKRIIAEILKGSVRTGTPHFPRKFARAT
jgi:hypothetical protein